MHERRFNREIERLRDPDRIVRMEVDRVVNLVVEGLPTPQTVLDIGTGSGLFAEQFASKGLMVTGLDVNPEMLTAAQHFVPSGTFREGIAEKLPFPDNTFDIVFMGLLLHETDDLLSALSEAYRVVIRQLAILEWPFEEQSFGPPIEHRIAIEKIELLAKQVGFSIVNQIPLNNLILYLLRK